MRFKFVVVACLLLVSGIVAVSNGLPTVGGEIDYYSDKTLKTFVGYTYKDCSGHTTHWGTTTQYWTFDRYACTGPICIAGGGDVDYYDGLTLVYGGCLSGVVCDPVLAGYSCEPF